jgi:hypothetical protein
LILRTDNLLAGKLILPFEGEAGCHCVVQRGSACGNHSGEAERDSGVGLKLFGFIVESVFAFIPESCSGSSRTAVRLHPGFMFILSRNPHADWMSFPGALGMSGIAGLIEPEGLVFDSVKHTDNAPCEDRWPHCADEDAPARLASVADEDFPAEGDPRFPELRGTFVGDAPKSAVR